MDAELKALVAKALATGEILQEVAEEAKAAVKELRSTPPEPPSLEAMETRLEALEQAVKDRLPRQPRPWHLMWWLTGPPPLWWVKAQQKQKPLADRGWFRRMAGKIFPWTVVRTVVGGMILGLLLFGLDQWLTPLIVWQPDGWWLGFRLWW